MGPAFSCVASVLPFSLLHHCLLFSLPPSPQSPSPSREQLLCLSKTYSHYAATMHAGIAEVWYSCQEEASSWPLFPGLLPQQLSEPRQGLQLLKSFNLVLGLEYKD